MGPTLPSALPEHMTTAALSTTGCKHWRFVTTFLRHRLWLAGTFGFVLAISAMAFASAQDAPTVALSGRVLSGDGAAVVGAIVTLRGNTDERTTHTDENGRFTLPRLARGSYAVHVVASGYEPLSSQTIGVRSATEFLTLILARSSSSLITIGRVQTSGGDAISTSSAPSTTIDSQRYAQLGYSRVSDVLQDDISTTLVHPLGGSTILPTSVALRGPDPTETLVDVDGHQVNNGNTGDFDLSLLDPADYGSIELVKGISPSSLVGPDTIDGAINIRTLDPTENAHGLLRLTGGSFNSFGETLQATGTYDRLGYAVSLHRTTTAGEVNQPIFDRTAGTTAQVGSAVDGSTALGKLRFAFGRRGGGYAEFSFHDQSQFRDFSAALSSVPSADAATPPATSPLEVLDGLEGTALAAHNSGYGLDVRTSLGTPDANGVARTSALFRHYTSFVSESVTGPAAATSPYLYGTRDVVGDDSLELDHQFSHATLAFQFGIRNENLATDFMNGVVNDQSVARRAGEDLSTHRFLFDAAPAVSNGSGFSQLGLAQTQRSAVLRYTYDPTASLHVTAATYYSNYSIFGTSLDPRFGLTFDPDSRSVVRFSVGTTFQAPQLPELYVPPVLPQSVGGYVSTGNPNLKPDYATEYGLGAEHIFETGRAARISRSICIALISERRRRSISRSSIPIAERSQPAVTERHVR